MTMIVKQYGSELHIVGASKSWTIIVHTRLGVEWGIGHTSGPFKTKADACRHAAWLARKWRDEELFSARVQEAIKAAEEMSK